MKNDYLPRPAKILSVKNETKDTKTYRLAFVDADFNESFSFKQGQFVEVSVLGEGEAPISISSSPSDKGYLELTVRAAGRVTSAINLLGEGDILFVRGPYGNSFPFEEVKGRNLVFVAGGIGLAPLRGLLRFVLSRRDDFGEIKILYGARSPQDLCFSDELDKWAGFRDTRIYRIVDRADENWNDRVGLVTELYSVAGITNGGNADGKRTAFVCGPPVMMKFAAEGLKELGFNPKDIVVTLERYMKCGIGKCGHCNIGSYFVCTDGPVFTWDQIESFTE